MKEKRCGRRGRKEQGECDWVVIYEKRINKKTEKGVYHTHYLAYIEINTM